MRKKKQTRKRKKKAYVLVLLLDKVLHKESQFVYSGSFFFFFFFFQTALLPYTFLIYIQYDVIGGKCVSCGCLFIYLLGAEGGLGSLSFHLHLPFVNYFQGLPCNCSSCVPKGDGLLFI